MKRILMTTTACAMLAAPAFAQEQTNSAFVAADSFAQSDSVAVRVSSLIGEPLYVTSEKIEGHSVDTDAIEWERIGDINDVILASDGSVEAIILDIGGFLGLGEKQVAMRVDQLDWVSGTNDGEEFYVVYQGDRSDLENAVEFDVSSVSDWMQDDASQPMAGEDHAEAPKVVGGDTEEAAQADMIGTDAQGNEAEVRAEADTAAEPKTDAYSDVAQSAEPMTTDPEKTAAVAGDLANAESDPVTTADAEPMVKDEGENVAMTAPTVSLDGYDTLESNALTTEELTGAIVYDTTDENIGEVNTLIMNENGELASAILDIGGFLGLGEKQVEVKMESLTIARAKDGGDIRVYVDATEDQLEDMPAYKG